MNVPRLPVSLFLALVLLVCGLMLALAAAADAVTPQISAGGSETCVLLSDGSAKCFGRNYYGELGNATNNGTNNPNPTPTDVPLGGPATQIDTGGSDTCAVLAGGTAKCFGNNFFGELGISANLGTSNANPNPSAVSLGAPAVATASAVYHTCAVLAGGFVKCFGINYSGQLGNATNNGSSAPNPPTTVALPTAAQVDPGQDHTCALLDNGAVMCFGQNFYGQLANSTGVGTFNVYPTPVAVSLGVPATQIAAATFHTCALLINGTVKCWGSNFYGQLGSAVPDPTPTPTTVALGRSAVQISTSDLFTCALLDDGTVKCFGDNYVGELGSAPNFGMYNPNSTPTATESLGAPAVQISAGGDHTCAILSDGTIKCWGDNTFGQLGSSLVGGYLPLTVPGLNVNVNAIAPPPGPSKTAVHFGRLKLKVKRSGRKLRVTAKLNLTGDSGAVPKSSCNGKLAVTASLRKKRVARKSFAVKSASRGTCQSKLSFLLAAKLKHKKVKFALALGPAAGVSAPAKTFTVKL
jgi:alpha-tubulin suppressor-like RCC1 family protein